MNFQFDATMPSNTQSVTAGAKASWTAAVLSRFPSATLLRTTRHIQSARGLVQSTTWRTFAAALWLAFASWSFAGERTADHDYDPPAPGTYTLPVIKPAADGALLDSTGKPVRLADLTRGRVTVLSFIYTRCADAKACPMATGVLRQLHRESAEDAALAKEMRLVSLSFDPANDTPERMAAYSTLAAARPTAAPWHFVTTRSQTELQPILTGYGQVVDRKPNPFEPTGPLNHTLRVFLIDRTGNLRNIYSSGTLDLRLVLADARTLMLEPAPAAAKPLTPQLTD
jgi:protein SCO1/2